MGDLNSLMAGKLQSLPEEGLDVRSLVDTEIH